MRRTMPKDDVAVIRGEVAVHLAAARYLARGFGSVRRSLNHGLNQPPTMFGDHSSGQQTRSPAFGGD